MALKLLLIKMNLEELFDLIKERHCYQFELLKANFDLVVMIFHPFIDVIYDA